MSLEKKIKKIKIKITKMIIIKIKKKLKQLKK